MSKKLNFELADKGNMKLIFIVGLKGRAINTVKEIDGHSRF